MKLCTRGDDRPPNLAPWDVRLVFSQTQSPPHHRLDTIPPRRAASAPPSVRKSSMPLVKRLTHPRWLWSCTSLLQIDELECKKGLVSH